MIDPLIPELNLVFGWLWFLIGALSGSLVGWRFQEEKWLGGYASWQRRLIRLGHISFFGTGLLNVMFATSFVEPSTSTVCLIASVSLVIGGVTMPLVCFLAANRKVFAKLFFVPVVSLSIGLAFALFEAAVRSFAGTSS